MLLYRPEPCLHPEEAQAGLPVSFVERLQSEPLILAHILELEIQEFCTNRICRPLQVWPLVHFINYKYVPTQLRVPYVSVASLFW